MSLWLLKLLTSSLALGAIPDLISQKLTRPRIDLRRTALMALCGGINGAILVEGFYRVLGHFYPQAEWVPRILWDQLCFSPVSNMVNMLLVFYLYQRRYGEIPLGLGQYIRQKFPLLQLCSWIYWTPAASTIYIFLPDAYKLFGQNIYAFFWGVLVSTVIHRKKAQA